MEPDNRFDYFKESVERETNAPYFDFQADKKILTKLERGFQEDSNKYIS